MKARVSVRIKPAILDPQGRTVLQSLNHMGYDEVSSVRIGKLIELELGGDALTARGRVEEMSRKLLSNPLVEDYQIELIDEAS